jgi:hypothetical protein
MEINFRSTFTKVFENYKDIEKCQGIIQEFYSDVKQGAKDQEQNNHIIHLITKAVRILYQENLIV